MKIAQKPCLQTAKCSMFGKTDEFWNAIKKRGNVRRQPRNQTKNNTRPLKVKHQIVECTVVFNWFLKKVRGKLKSNHQFSHGTILCMAKFIEDQFHEIDAVVKSLLKKDGRKTLTKQTLEKAIQLCYGRVYSSKLCDAAENVYLAWKTRNYHQNPSKASEFSEAPVKTEPEYEPTELNAISFPERTTGDHCTDSSQQVTRHLVADDSRKGVTQDVMKTEDHAMDFSQRVTQYLVADDSSKEITQAVMETDSFWERTKSSRIKHSENATPMKKSEASSKDSIGNGLKNIRKQQIRKRKYSTSFLELIQKIVNRSNGAINPEVLRYVPSFLLDNFEKIGTEARTLLMKDNKRTLDENTTRLALRLSVGEFIAATA